MLLLMFGLRDFGRQLDLVVKEEWGPRDKVDNSIEVSAEIGNELIKFLKTRFPSTEILRFPPFPPRTPLLEDVRKLVLNRAPEIIMPKVAMDVLLRDLPQNNGAIETHIDSDTKIVWDRGDPYVEIKVPAKIIGSDEMPATPGIETVRLK